jgi:GT2 family glycosyltransferase
MLKQVGMFDESFFMYCEDVDLNWRSQWGGWRCWYAPEAVIYHKLSATGGGPIASFYTGRNTIWVLAKDVPAVVLRRHWQQIVRAQARVASDALRAWRGQAARARLRGQMAGLLSWPRLMQKRRAIQAGRRVPDEYLASLVTQGRSETAR